jgi:hypothetical protein
MNEPSNAVSFLDKDGHLRVFQIMEELVFEETVTSLCLRLLKILSTSADVATQIAETGGIKSVVDLIKENTLSESIIALGCQAMCKMIVTLEVAKSCLREGVIDLMADLCVESDNWANIAIMGEIIKVVVNFSVVEENAVTFIKKAVVPFLRSIEAHSDNAVYLQNAAMALSKLSMHPNCSRTLVKRGAIPVICASARINIERRGVLARYLRTLSNFLYTEARAGESVVESGAMDIFEAAVSKHARYEPIQKEWKDFLKAMKLKSKKVVHSKGHKGASIRSELDPGKFRMMAAGCLMRKHGAEKKGGKIKPKKRTVRVDDECTVVIFEDPDGKKAPKQLSLKAIQRIQPGNTTKGFGPKTKFEQTFAIISVDPNGREFTILLETRTEADCTRWMAALGECVEIIKKSG